MHYREKNQIKRRSGASFTGGCGMAAFAALVLMSARQQPSDAQARSHPTQSKDAASSGHATGILPLVKKYCLDCHSTQAKRGHLDLQRFATSEHIRREAQTWQGVVEHLEVGDMPPQGHPQPTSGEKQQLLAQVRALLATEANARAGDPGYVPLRRLSNAEYNATIRDLTGVDMQPAREFPADGAAGEGFTNAAEALTDISPDLLTKYFNAAREIADHAQLLPDGIRFALGKTRRDWTDESTARLRAFYAACPEAGAKSDGKLAFQPYLAALVRHRDALIAGQTTLNKVAIEEKLNAKYLRILWQALTDTTPSYPLDAIRAQWRKAAPDNALPLIKEVTAWQSALWQTVRVGSYVHAVGKGFGESVTRQIAVNPTPAETRTLRTANSLTPGQNEVPNTQHPTPDTRPPAAGLSPGQNENVTEARLLAGYADFRRCFPLFVCFPGVIPNDEVVSLKMFHREDEPLRELFLDAEQTRRLDRLWTEHRFLSRQPVAENTYLPLFIGFVSQDQPKELLSYFESQRPVFRARAEAFEKEEAAAIPQATGSPP